MIKFIAFTITAKNYLIISFVIVLESRAVMNVVILFSLAHILPYTPDK